MEGGGAPQGCHALSACSAWPPAAAASGRRRRRDGGPRRAPRRRRARGGFANIGGGRGARGKPAAPKPNCLAPCRLALLACLAPLFLRRRHERLLVVALLAPSGCRAGLGIFLHRFCLSFPRVAGHTCSVAGFGTALRRTSFSLSIHTQVICCLHLSGTSVCCPPSAPGAR